MPMNMRTKNDCGPVAIANLIEAARGVQAERTYERILDEFGFRGLTGIRADLWDSPARHFDAAGALLGAPVGLVDELNVAPAVALFRLGAPVGLVDELNAAPAVALFRSGLSWHWATLLSSSPGERTWHTGTGVVSAFPHPFPAARVVLAYSPTGRGRLPVYWKIWRRLTDLVL